VDCEEGGQEGWRGQVVVGGEENAVCVISHV
jgi:hypothetical protein